MSIRIVELAAIDSTNAEALRRAALGERGPLWIRAEAQHSGRGRSGRAWASEAGNLAASLVFVPECPVDKLPQLAFVFAVAVHDAVAAVLPARNTAQLRLKWPNDLLIGEAKFGGLLIESTSFGGETVAVVGIGINIVAAPVLAGRQTTTLMDAGAATTPRELLQQIAERTQTWLAIWDRGGGFAAIRAAWTRRAGPMGERLTVNTGDGPVAGTYFGIDETGALLLQGECDAAGSPGQVRRFSFGDVELVRGGTETTR